MAARHVRRIECRDREHARRFMQALLEHADEHDLWVRADGLLAHWSVFSIQRDDGPCVVVIEQRKR